MSLEDKEHRNKEAISSHILISSKQVLLNMQWKYLQLIVNYAWQNIKKKRKPALIPLGIFSVPFWFSTTRQQQFSSNYCLLTALGQEKLMDGVGGPFI